MNRKEALKRTNRQILHSFTVNEHTFRRVKILLKRIEQFSRSETMDSYIFHVIARNELSKCSSYALCNYNTSFPSNCDTSFPSLYLSPPRVPDTSFLNHPVYLYTRADRICIYVALGRMPRHPLPLAAWPTRQERFPGPPTPPSISSTATTPPSFYPPR